MKRTPENIARLANEAAIRAREACGELLPARTRHRVTRDAERIESTVSDLVARREGRWREAKAAWTEACGLWWELAQHGAIIVKSEIRRCGGLMPEEDLRQEAWIGLYEAARRFDPERGIKFVTVAKWWVRAMLTRSVDKRAWEVSVSATRSQQALVARRFARAAEAKGRHLTRRELAALVGLTEDVLNDALAATARNAGISDGPSTLDSEPLPMAETLHAEPWDPEADIESAEVKARLDAAIQRLDPRAAAIVRSRLAGETLKACGDPHGLSRERARQIETKSLECIRQALLEFA